MWMTHSTIKNLTKSKSKGWFQCDGDEVSDDKLVSDRWLNWANKNIPTFYVLWSFDVD